MPEEIRKVMVFVDFVKEWGNYLTEYDREKLNVCLSRYLEREVFKLKTKEVKDE